jgi:hypothetical protein
VLQGSIRLTGHIPLFFDLFLTRSGSFEQGGAGFALTLRKRARTMLFFARLFHRSMHLSQEVRTNSMPMHQMALITRKGNKMMAFSNLKSMSMENPTMRKGKRIIHTMGNRMITISASGQQAMNRNAHKISAMKVRMLLGFKYASQSPASFVTHLGLIC